MRFINAAFGLLPALASFPAAGQPPPLSVAPQLVLSTNYVSTVIAATNPTQVVEAYNAGAGALNLTATASASWLSASVGALRACTTRSGDCYPITISFNAQSLSPGNYTEYVTVTDPNAIDSPQQITVNATVGGIPTTLSLYATPAGGPMPAATVPLYPLGSIKATTDQPWLVVSGSTGLPGSAPYTIEAIAQPNLPAGVYTGNIIFTTTAGYAADDMGIKVTFTITTAPIIETPIAPVQITGDQGGSSVTSYYLLTNPGGGTLALTAATANSTTGNFLSASVANGNTVAIIANPGSLAPGLYTGSVTIVSNAANNAQVTIPVEFTVNPQAVPQISMGGVVNIATYLDENLAQGDIVAIFGDQLAPPGTSAQNSGPPPLATKLGNTQILVNGVAAPLYFVSPGQVNFQLSYGAQPGPATVQVLNNGISGNTRSVNVVAAEPRVLIWPSVIIPGAYGIIVNGDGSLTLPSGTTVSGFKTKPAKAGDTVVIYSVGLGQTSPAAADGAAAGTNPTQQVHSVSVEFGGIFEEITTATSAYAGLTPTAVGLYQINVTIPPNTPTGSAVPVTIVADGTTTNATTMAISQ
jgi:uncharacterized protein (TIGR03437 family)